MEIKKVAYIWTLATIKAHAMRYFKIIVLLIGSFSIAQYSLGQTKYFSTDSGKVIDTLVYNKMKEETIQRVKALFPNENINIEESLKLLRSTKDSLIYSYKWEVQVDEPENIQKEENIFKNEDYIDKLFPIQELLTFNNDTIFINDLKGKPTLINFWFTSCKPCIEEIPVLNTIKKQFKDSVNFIAITFDSKAQVENFLKKHKFDFIQVVDAENITDFLKIKSFPLNIFLDKNGLIRRIENGIPYVLDENDKMKMGDGRQFIKYIQKIL